MNPSSPFAVSSGEQFTVRELTNLVPAQFLRPDAAAHGDQVVHLPVELLKTSLRQGRPALRLSQLYLSCPSVFARPVQPAEDVEIVLPFQKVKRLVEPGDAAANPFAAASAGESSFAVSPFAQNGAAAAAASSPASPFVLRPVPAAKTAPSESPFPARAAAAAPSAHGEVLSPFSQESGPAPAGQPRQVASPFSLVSPAVAVPAAGAPGRPSPATAPVPVAPIVHRPAPVAQLTGHDSGSAGHGTAPVPPPPAVPASPAPAAVTAPGRPAAATAPVSSHTQAVARPSGDSSRSLKVTLASLLRDVTATDLGFDPASVPSHLEAVISYDTILPQLATGRVEVGIDELRQGVDERVRPALSRVRADLRLVVPLSEVFQSLPASAIPSPQPAEHIPVTTSPFQTPFAIKADEDQSRIQLPTLLPGTSTASIPSVTPFPVAPPVPSAHAGNGLGGIPVAPQLPAAPASTARPSPFSRPPGTSGATAPVPVPPATATPAPPAGLSSLPGGEQHDDLGQSFPAASLRAEPPAPVAVTAPVSVPASASAPAVTTPVPPLPPAASIPPASEPFDPARLFPKAAAAPAPVPVAVESPPPASVTATVPVQPEAPAPLPMATPAPVPAPVMNTAPVVTRPPAARPAPAAASAPAGVPPIEFNFSETPDIPRLTLRALFMTDEDLPPARILELCAQLPGLRACVAITPAGLFSGGHPSGGTDIDHFTANASRAFEYLTGLAENMGIDGVGSFTLRSGNTVRTFFIEQDLCLAVLHGQGAFSPGVRDRLLLTARALAGTLS